MARRSLIGNLAVNLIMETAAFEKGATQAEKRLNRMSREIRSAGQNMVDLGQKLSLSVTAPIAAAGAAVVKMTGDFEAAMNRVSISTQAGATEMKAMSDLALKLGKDTIFGASDAADAMDMLAKNGLSAKQILEGAATATVELAAAAGSQLDPAAAAITDVMQQFKLATQDLPDVINQITGAVNESKLDFADFTLAIGQAGGVAGASGVSFEDFNAVLAGTSALFASGSDAGTSFKTFISSLPGKSKQSAEAIAELGLQFYNADGSLRSMAEIAQELQDKLGGLSDIARQQYLTKIFGTDAMRTAVALMDQGAAGIDKIRAKIAETDAAAQSAQRLKGFNGQMEELQGSIETLAIRIGQSGLLEIITRITTGLANLIDKWSEASPATLRFVTVIAAVAAAIGPVLIVVGALVKVFAPLIAAFKMIAGAGGVLTAAGAFSALGAALGPILVPLAAVAAAAALIYANWDKIAPVLRDFWKAAQETLGPPLKELIATISSALSELWNGPIGEGIRMAIGLWGELQSSILKALGPVVLVALKALIQGLANLFSFIGDGVRLVSALFRGDWETAFVAAASIVDRLFFGLPGKIVGIVAKIVNAIRTWMVDRLNAIWDSVKGKIEAVKRWFYDLYDAVVGNSYIPDMVDGIARNMARLEQEMVAPAKSAAERTKAVFEKLQSDVTSLMRNLFPEAAAQAELLNQNQILQSAIKAGGAAGYTVPQLEEAQRRILTKGAKENLSGAIGGTLDGIGKGLSGFFVNLGELGKKVAEETARTKVAFRDMAQDVLYSLDNLGRSIKRGGFLDIFGSLLDVVFQLGSVGVFGKNFQTSVNSKNFGGFRAMGGPVVPGKSYIVGENGPEWFTPGGGGAITPMGDSAAAIVQIVPSPYFDVAVQQGATKVAAPMAAATGQYARQAAQGDSRRAARRRIPG